MAAGGRIWTRLNFVAGHDWEGHDFSRATTGCGRFGFSRWGSLFQRGEGWCREQDLNLHAFWALDPKSNASANSAIPACAYFNRRGVLISFKPECQSLIHIGLPSCCCRRRLRFRWRRSMSMVMAPARPAACHQHEGALPSPQPVSYRCCQSGHDSAIVQSSRRFATGFGRLRRSG